MSRGQVVACRECGTEFQRTVKAPKYYCTVECRRKQNNRSQAENIARWHKLNPHVNILRSLKHRAKRRGLAFSLDKKDIVIPEFCPVLGIRLQSHTGKGHGGKFDSPSVDRIDNALGYVKGNVQVISQLANAMKSEANPEQLLKFAEWVMSTYGGKIDD